MSAAIVHEVSHAPWRMAGLVGLAFLLIAMALGHVLDQAPAHLGPVLVPPSAGFVFGTDLIGRSLLRGTLNGMQVSLRDALIAMVVTLAAGSPAGFRAARLRWRLSAAVRGFVRIFAAVPALLLALVLIAILGRDLAPLAVGLAAAPPAFLRTHDRIGQLANAPHVQFARATGILPSVLLRRDFAYEFRDGLLVNAARALTGALILLATVSFLGFGAVPPQRDLGLMIAASLPSYLDAWWTAAFPALALFLLILSIRLALGTGEGERP